MELDSDEWLRRFAARGWAMAKPLGGGMEGAVYELDEELIAKVWSRKQGPELVELQAFYEGLAAAGLDFATPRILELWEGDGVPVTIEPRLPGVPLDRVRPFDRPPGPDAVACMLDVLEGLHGAGDAPGARALPVLGESRAMWEGAGSWPAALAALLERRLAVCGDQLRARVPGFERMAERLLDSVAEFEVGELTVLHGDLIPANVLVDESVRPVAVLDFGFFTTVGDPLFDLAVTASIYDMYGSRAAASEAAIDAATARRREVPPERLVLYRAAYAVATANVYDAAGEDGHFNWCVEMLGRPEVAAVLGA